MVDIVVVAAVFGTILFSFLVVPEILERRGCNPRSAFARAIVWLTFLTIVLIPAAATGYLFGISSPGDWLIFVVAMAVAILYDYYRLNPHRVPWRTRRA